jgi:TPR repeat protein
MSANNGTNFTALKAYRAKDYATALGIWEQLALQNDDQAITNIGLMYLKGEGVTKDFAKAYEYFVKGAELDNDSANYNLALMYQSAIGLPEDMEKALFHYRKATAKNHQNANFRLALLLLKDRTNLETVKEGFECMLNAALDGHPVAMTQMGGVDKPVNDTCELNLKFRTKSYEEQMALVDDALDRYIKPILIKDGGNITVLEYKNEPNIELRLAYLGNCAGCSLGATSTYELIKSTLSQVIDENIRIYII